jgi:hypothetical protein
MNPIGTATLTLLGYTATATLHADGTWSFEGDHMAAWHLHNASRLVGPGDGRAKIHQLAEKLQGQVPANGVLVIGTTSVPSVAAEFVTHVTEP